MGDDIWTVQSNMSKIIKAECEYILAVCEYYLDWIAKPCPLVTVTILKALSLYNCAIGMHCMLVIEHNDIKGK